MEKKSLSSFQSKLCKFDKIEIPKLGDLIQDERPCLASSPLMTPGNNLLLYRVNKTFTHYIHYSHKT